MSFKYPSEPFNRYGQKKTQKCDKRYFIHPSVTLVTNSASDSVLINSVLTSLLYSTSKGSYAIWIQVRVMANNNILMSSSFSVCYGLQKKMNLHYNINAFYIPPPDSWLLFQYIYFKHNQIQRKLVGIVSDGWVIHPVEF